MGFKDLYSFNLAMLCKQVWMLNVDPNSLCAQVLKAKYYPSDDILNAGPNTGSSFTWQSIVGGIQTFKRGLIWRIGDGETVNIWSPWIPSSANRKIMNQRGTCVLSKASELIDRLPANGINSCYQVFTRLIFTFLIVIMYSL
jgi:hypothetical protein